MMATQFNVISFFFFCYLIRNLLLYFENSVCNFVWFSAKILHELILPIETRVKEVRNFIETINTSLEYEVVPIEVPFGAAINDSNLDVRFIFSTTKYVLRVFVSFSQLLKILL